MFIKPSNFNCCDGNCVNLGRFKLDNLRKEFNQINKEVAQLKIVSICISLGEFSVFTAYSASCSFFVSENSIICVILLILQTKTDYFIGLSGVRTQKSCRAL